VNADDPDDGATAPVPHEVEPDTSGTCAARAAQPVQAWSSCASGCTGALTCCSCASLPSA
jgi:hypothetical protein